MARKSVVMYQMTGGEIDRPKLQSVIESLAFVMGEQPHPAPRVVGFVPWFDRDMEKGKDLFFRDFSTEAIRLCLRVDQRKIPGPVMKAEYAKAMKEWLSRHPGMVRVPKAAREDLRCAVVEVLMKKVLPVPKFIEGVVYNGRLYVLTAANADIDLFCEALNHHVVKEVPAFIFNRITTAYFAEAIQQALPGKCTFPQDLGLVYMDTMLPWLMAQDVYEVMVDETRYAMQVNNRVVLNLAGEIPRKTTITGEMGEFEGVRTALTEGALSIECGLHIGDIGGADEWECRYTPDTHTLRSIKTPTVKLERMPDSPADEEEGVFWEWLALFTTCVKVVEAVSVAYLGKVYSTDKQGAKAVNAEISEWMER